MPLASTIELPERYRVARHIASGGMASVWEAEDLLLGRVVAVKVLAAQYAADPGARARFQREARTAAQVSDQSHVVTIYDIGEHENDAFIVMEYFAGGTVADRLRVARKSGEPIPRETALRWLREAAAGLDVAHAAGIVHRDVKPANLLLDSQGRLAVADFGIARLADDTQMTQTGQVLGTAAYISPEQAHGQPATAASDRYALAVVAYELLTGSRPFPGGPPTAQALAHAKSAPPRPSQASPDLPRALDGVLLRGLAKDPDDRPATATELLAAIEHVLGAQVVVDPTRAFPALDATKPAERAAPPPPPIVGLGAGALGARHATPAAAAQEPAPAAAADPPAATPPSAGRAPGPAPEPTPAAASLPVPAPPAAARPRVIAPQPPRPAAPPREPDASAPPPMSRRRGPAPALAGAALAAAVAVALVLALSSGDDPQRSSDRPQGQSTQPAKQRTATTPATSAQQPTTAPPAAAAPAAPASTGASGAAALNDRGFTLNKQGRYADAVTPLRESVAAYKAADQLELPYAYAIFNLAVALNRSGSPAEAIPLLQERLQYDDQPAKVRDELRDAQARLAGSTGDTKKPGKAKDKKDY
ncbi:MAG TPA: serine/threonine-protein kinase [Solirubrobacteraceae bacterium]|jgi:serine/threonine-protein kinase|nr:serine/threonine-protein kinase [Solirubrobacteraceae bacterium]